MDQCPGLRSGHLLAMLLLSVAILLPAAGCANACFTVAYLFNGTDKPAECDELKEKRVVVVCYQESSSSYANGRVDQELAEKVARILKEKVSKIKLVEQRKVNEWMDEHGSGVDDLAEVGKAHHADMVVGIVLDRFSLFAGQTLFQGKANVILKVYDCKKGDIVFNKRLPQFAYPRSTGISTTEKPEAEFRREFVGLLAEQLARPFHSYDPDADYARDSKTLESP
ncbi:MAG: hypothetical protein ACLQNE_13435 [Thermoguttaceae bacterium]